MALVVVARFVRDRQVAENKEWRRGLGRSRNHFTHPSILWERRDVTGAPLVDCGRRKRAGCETMRVIERAKRMREVIECV